MPFFPQWNCFFYFYQNFAHLLTFSWDITTSDTIFLYLGLLLHFIYCTSFVSFYFSLYYSYSCTCLIFSLRLTILPCRKLCFSHLLFLVASITEPSTEMLDKYLNRIQISYLGKLYLLMSISIMFNLLKSLEVFLQLL